jgi:hypothetical protein
VVRRDAGGSQRGRLCVSQQRRHSGGVRVHVAAVEEQVLASNDDLRERALAAGVVERNTAIEKDAAKLLLLVGGISERLGGEIATRRGARGAADPFSRRARCRPLRDCDTPATMSAVDDRGQNGELGMHEGVGGAPLEQTAMRAIRQESEACAVVRTTNPVAGEACSVLRKTGPVTGASGRVCSRSSDV